MAIIPILPQTNDPKETQRALLDLASKIPSSSGGNIYALNQANYTETNNDAYDMIDVNCGASSRTITLRKAGTTLLRRRMYAKNDSGAGEILLVAQAGQKIYYPGGSASQMYVGLQYQFVTLEETASGYYITGGVVQRVAGEPSLGTPHDTKTMIGATWFQAITAGAWVTITFGIGNGPGQVPVGSKKVKVFCLITTGATDGGSHFAFYRPFGSGEPISSILAHAIAYVYTNTAVGIKYSSGQIELPIDSSGRVDIGADFGCNLYLSFPSDYLT
jgi:hypothetical protein